ncbi:hypothetical protein KC333_g174 [Hortaea werneckii]|nr:hypothetical protein KC333_g174 [Hortaea werneckii]
MRPLQTASDRCRSELCTADKIASIWSTFRIYDVSGLAGGTVSQHILTSFASTSISYQSKSRISLHASSNYNIWQRNLKFARKAENPVP